MWSEGRYDYQRLTGERVHPPSHPSDGCQRELNIVPKKPLLLGKRPPLLRNRPPRLDSPGEGSYNRYYSDVGYQEYEEHLSFSHKRRSGSPQRGDGSGHRRSRYDHSEGRQRDFRRKSFYSSRYRRDQSFHRPFYQESSLGQKDHAIVNTVAKKPPLLEKRPLLLDKPGEESYTRYYSDVRYLEYDEGCSFSHDRRSGRPHKGDKSGNGWSRHDHSASHQSDFRHIKDSFRRKSVHSSHYRRDLSRHSRDPPFPESPIGQNNSPRNKSISSVPSRSCSAVRNKTYSFHELQHSSKARLAQSLKASRYTSFSSPTALPSSKMLYKSSRITEKELAEAASKRSVVKLETSKESNLSRISEFKVKPTAPLVPEQPEESDTNVRNSRKLYEDGQISNRSKAIASKMEETEQVYGQQAEEPDTNVANRTKLCKDSLMSSRSKLMKEIKQAYRQNSETAGMVARRMIEKDPSLEESIQLSLKQSLQEIVSQLIEGLKHSIAEYDTST